jgi:5-methyltetrahydropteroyltriglutamate--homocysteine methyltransferase
VLAVHSGGYPRPPEWRKSNDMYNAGKLDYISLISAWERNTKKVIYEQAEENLDVLTSGHIAWDDIFRPFAEGWSGVELPEVGGYYRFYELNFYYKRAIVNGPIRPTRPVMYKEYLLASEISPRPLKLSIPGPLTFVTHVENEFYEDVEDLLNDITYALAYEVDAVEGFADYVQIEEPALVDPEMKPEDIDLGIEYINKLANMISIPVIVKTYFKPASEVYKLLLNLNVDGLGFDMVVWNYEDLKDTINEYGYPYEILDLGVSDALNVKLEPIEETVSKVMSVLDEACPRELHLSHNYRLDVLPYSHVRKKMRRLAEIALKLRETVEEGVK